MGKNKKLSHEECRPKVCIFCFSQAQRPLSKSFIESFHLLKENLEFNLDDPKAPTGICNLCNLKYSKAKGGFGVENLTFKNFDFVILSEDIEGQCALCQKAKRTIILHRNSGKVKFWRGVPGRPRTSPQFRSATLDLNAELKSGPKMSFCLRCQTTIPSWKFKQHKCSNRVLIKNLIGATSKKRLSKLQK